MTRTEAIRNKAKEVIALAEAKYGVDLSSTVIRFDLKGTSAGMAIMRNGKYSLRFNTTMIAGDGFEHILNVTVPHEVAHLVNFADRSTGWNHNAGWARVCRALGGEGSRCHSEAVLYARGKTWEYTTDKGHKVTLSDARHKKILKGVSYTVKGKGSLNNACEREVIGINGNPVKRVDTAPKATTPTAPKATGTRKGTKAEEVRNKLRSGMNPDAVVEWAIAEFGFKRGLARAYVKNNIGK